MGTLEAEYAEAMDRMDRAAAEWLEARAGGRDTDAPDARWKAAERETRRIERRLRRRGDAVNRSVRTN